MVYDINNHLIKPITSTPYTELDINLQGDYLYFTANYNKIYSIYAFNIKDQNFYKLTNGGFSQRSTVIGDSLFFIGLRTFSRSEKLIIFFFINIFF